MSVSDDDELDGILDSALDGFDAKEPSSPAAPSPAAAKATSEPDSDAATAEALRAFEEALKPLDAGVGGATTGASEEEDMQLIADFIKSFEKLAPGESPSAAAPSASAPAPADAAPGIEGAIKSLIDNVLSKDILHEPMLQIRASMRAWLEQQTGLPADERARREGQLAIVGDICGEYEGETDAARVIDLLARLRESGALPADVMKELPDDGGDAPGGQTMDELAAGCPMQ